MAIYSIISAFIMKFLSSSYQVCQCINSSVYVCVSVYNKAKIYGW